MKYLLSFAAIVAIVFIDSTSCQGVVAPGDISRPIPVPFWAGLGQSCAQRRCRPGLICNRQKICALNCTNVKCPAIKCLRGFMLRRPDFVFRCCPDCVPMIFTRGTLPPIEITPV